MAEIVALVAAFFFALAATLQQKGALGLGEVSFSSPASFLRLAKQTWWLLGTVALLAGYVFQAIALANGRLAVIQPLLVTTIVFALPLGLLPDESGDPEERGRGGRCRRARPRDVHRRGRRRRRSRQRTCGRVGGRSGRVLPRSPWRRIVLGGRGSDSRKAALYGVCAGVLFGLSASLCKPTMEILGDDGVGGVLTSWEAYAFAITGVVAFVVQQISLSKGNLAASVATVSVCNPLVSIVIGTLLLDERLAEPTWHKVVAYVRARAGPRRRRAHLDGDREREGGEGRRAGGSGAGDLAGRSRHERQEFVLPFLDHAVVRLRHLVPGARQIA